MPYVQHMKLLNTLHIIKLCFLLELFAQIYISALDFCKHDLNCTIKESIHFWKKCLFLVNAAHKSPLETRDILQVIIEDKHSRPVTVEVLWLSDGIRR